MIAVVSVEIQAANPSMPLYPWRAYVNSPSSLRIRNVPRRVGNWNIDKVYVSAAYPDNSIKSSECVLVGGIWVCTIAGSTVSGFSQNGYTIFADGKDENGNAVNGYVLGKGDITILEADGTITPGQDTFYMHLLEEEPTTPHEGDVWMNSDGEYVVWQNDEAHVLGVSEEWFILQLAAKQDKLSDTQISAIDSVVDERQTVITFSDNTTSSFNWVGEITIETMIDAGLFDEDIFTWVKNPVTVKIGNTVTNIGTSTFRNCTNLTSVTIPDSVTSIGVGAFAGCANLTSVTIPDSVTNIGMQAFYDCSGLTSVTIPNSVTSIEQEAFFNCTSLANITLPDSVTSIGGWAFGNCSALPEITLPKNVPSIGENAFNGTSQAFYLYFTEFWATSQIPYIANYPWGVYNTAHIQNVRNATKEWVEEQGYGKGFLWRNATVTARQTCFLTPFYINSLTLAAARASFKVMMNTNTSTTAGDLYFALTLGNFTQPMTWDTPFDMFEGGSAEAIAPLPNTMNIYHVFEYASGHFMVEKFNGAYEELEKYATTTYAVKNDGGVAKIKSLTQAQYDALASVDLSTLYVIPEEA